MKNIITLIALALLAFSCKKEDKICPPGFGGDDCEQEIKPKSVKLTHVYLVKYPPTNNGLAWDDFSTYADPYFTITNAATLEVVEQSPYQEEISPAAGALWQVNATCSPDASFVFTFYDYDSAANDNIIGGFVWNTYKNGEKFPTTVTLSENGLEVQLILGYEF